MSNSWTVLDLEFDCHWKLTLYIRYSKPGKMDTIPAVYCSTMSLRTLGRCIIFYTLYVNIHDLHAKGPGINTLYVPIGQLNPKVTLLGSLSTSTRGKDALELANTFLHYHRSIQKIGKWTSQDRQIHFMTIKRNRVQQNIDILEADLHQVHEQYRIPGKTYSIDSSNKTSSRRKRGINFDIEIDVNKCLNTVVQGVVFIS